MQSAHRRVWQLQLGWMLAGAAWAQPAAQPGLSSFVTPARTPPTPQATQSAALPQSNNVENRTAPRIYGARLTPHWFAGNRQFWYRLDLPDDRRQFIRVHAENGTRESAFDHAAVAAQLGGGIPADRLPVESLQFSDTSERITLIGQQRSWVFDSGSGSLTEIDRSAMALGGKGLMPVPGLHSSRRSGPETEITFDNRLQKPVQLFWLDDEGGRHSYGKLSPGAQRVQHTFAGHAWAIDDEQGRTIAVFQAGDHPDRAAIDGSILASQKLEPAREPESSGDSSRSGDGLWTAFLRNDNIVVRSRAGAETQLTTNGTAACPYGALTWSPDSKHLIAWQIELAERKPVFLVRSSPPRGGRAQLESRPYALPGDPFPRYELNLFELETQRHTKPAVDPFEHEWETPQLHWTRDGTRFRYQQVDRGHQRLRVIEVAPSSGTVRNLIDERSKTFLWTIHTEALGMPLVHWLEETDDLIYASEQSGWRHLYLVDGQRGSVRAQLTRGEWVVRGIHSIDEKAQQICISASGRHPGQDPYNLHFYRVAFDGSPLVPLTDGDGNHSIEFSPDKKHLIDTWSRPDSAPRHALRRASDGMLLCELESADINELKADGLPLPEPFVANGRDGKTEICGLIHRPRHLDPEKKYPIIEYIYAGPQGSFVPKSFRARSGFEALLELGFVVVQIDGMGTAHRSKAFHDVCWKNLKDGGFPDRICWIKAAAARYPYLDLDRVGIYGNSAGGQNAAAAVLFHPEFYKAAVASCGCHDNRMDKASWNEQWMGTMPSDQLWIPSPDNAYSQSSNIDNAHRLIGKLFLIVGEMDKNVPPESTLRFVDALIRADKNFELLVIPNGGHGMGGAYGERRMRDFFSRHLRPAP